MRKCKDNMLYCCACGTTIACELKTGREVYPHRPDLYNIKMYECPNCHNRVGVHRGTTKALGCVPTPEIRQARMKVHALIDPLWKSGKMKRATLYKTISDKLGYPYHTGNSKSLEELREVYKIGLELWQQESY